LPNDGTHARCHVLRKRGPLGVFPTYVLYLDGRETTTATLGDAVPILVARKRKKSKCTHYVIGDDGAERAVNEAHASYVGKLKANFIGTHFELLDSGVRPRAWGAPRHLDDEADDEEQGPPRRALANIRYAVNVLGAGGPRALSVSLLGDDVDDPNAVAHELESARPTWNPSAQAYVLNFNGRVTRPSVKNFQLVSSGLAAAGAPSRADAESRTLTRGVLQFGRVDDDLFTLDFAHPLSPLTAFAACLSAFESKFARE
jgi:tubby-related protein 1